MNDLDTFYNTSIQPLQSKLNKEAELIDKVNKLRVFMEDVREMGADRDLVQFQATLCQRGDDLMAASLAASDVEEMTLGFESSLLTIDNLILTVKSGPKRSSPMQATAEAADSGKLIHGQLTVKAWSTY